MKKRIGIILAILCLSFIPKLAFAESQSLCSYTFTAPKSTSEEYCLDHFSEIKYVKIDFGVDSSVQNMQIGYNTLNYSNTGGRTSYTIGFSSLPYNYIQQVVGATEEYPLTISFYDSFPSDCPACPTCPTCQDCSEPSTYIQIIIDAFWKFVVGFAGGAAALIAILIVFRYIRKVF